MRPVKSILKVIAYPYVRVLKDVSSSAANTRKAYEQSKEVRAKRREHLALQAQLVDGLTPAQKFAELVETYQWTPAGLMTQMTAVRRTRYAGVVALVLLLAVFLWLVSFAPLLLIAIMAPILMVLMAFVMAFCVRYGWYEYTLETKTCISMRDFFARADVFRRSLWKP